MTVLVAMQPTFLPWSGYFDLIEQADHFVYLDTVQFSRQSWQHRNRIRDAQGLSWFSLPVVASHREGTTVSEAKVGSTRVVRKWRATLRQCYARAKARETELPWIDAWLASLREGDSLADINIRFIELVGERFGIATQRSRASDLGAIAGRVDRLVGLCQLFGTDTYLSPPGAVGYLTAERAAFERAGIALRFQSYAHPTYGQCHGPFLPYASVVDLILNEGDAGPAVLRSGRREPITALQLLESLKAYEDRQVPSA